MRTSQRELSVALPFRVYGERVFQLVRFPKNVLLTFIDIFGIAPINQLSNWLMQEAQNKSKSYYVIVADERAFLLAMNGDQSAMIVDSHRHGSKGAIIACCKRGHVGSFALWFDAMMNATWVVLLTIASISPVYY